jgi:hypothetical protein
MDWLARRANLPRNSSTFVMDAHHWATPPFEVSARRVESLSKIAHDVEANGV